jgi:hypothetical protein
MAKEITQTVSTDTAAVAMAVGILANTALKTAIALAFGVRQFRIVVAGALTIVMIAAVASIVLIT